MPEASRAEYEAYFRAVNTMRADLPPEQAIPLRRACTVFLRVLWHTGGDVGEVRKLIVGDIRWPQQVEDGTPANRCFAELRLRRTKVKCPERRVPYPSAYVREIREFIESRGLKHDDLVFGCLRQRVGPTTSYLPDIITAHKRGVEAIGRSFRIKDIRHLAAIAWAEAGVRLEQIRTWLGHATIKQTTIYLEFTPKHGDIYDQIERAAGTRSAQ